MNPDMRHLERKQDEEHNRQLGEEVTADEDGFEDLQHPHRDIVIVHGKLETGGYEEGKGEKHIIDEVSVSPAAQVEGQSEDCTGKIDSAAKGHPDERPEADKARVQRRFDFRVEEGSGRDLVEIGKPDTQDIDAWPHQRVDERCKVKLTRLFIFPARANPPVPSYQSPVPIDFEGGLYASESHDHRRASRSFLEDDPRPQPMNPSRVRIEGSF